MQQLTQEKPATTLYETLVQLRQTVANSDPLALPANDPCSAHIQALTEAFEAASPAKRQSLLLRALDEAIAAIEIAARLADAMNGTPTGASGHTAGQQPLDVVQTGSHSQQTTDAAQDPLFAAYHAFAESQPTYQELYHYRNALAEQLRTARDDGDSDL